LDRNKILILIKTVVAATFIFSAISKILSPGYFEITLIDQGLFIDRNTAAYFARLFIIIEFAIGFLFLQTNYVKKIVSPATILLLVAFIIHMSILLITGDNGNCGCFSSIISMNQLEAIIKNIVLILLIVYVYKYSEAKRNRLTIPTVIIVLSVVIVFIFAPIKNADNFPFTKYTHFENYGRVDLTDGEFLIPIFDANCEHCVQTAKSLKRISTDIETLPKIFVLIFSESEEEVKEFQDSTGIDYPYHRISVDEFFDLIGSAPPRIYWVENGKVKEIWDENIEENLWEKFSKKNEKYIELNIE
jgi:hypothetical protein